LRYHPYPDVLQVAITNHFYFSLNTLPKAPIDANAFNLAVCKEGQFKIDEVFSILYIRHAVPLPAYLGLVY
jgi:hypothetical protein